MKKKQVSVIRWAEDIRFLSRIDKLLVENRKNWTSVFKKLGRREQFIVKNPQNLRRRFGENKHHIESIKTNKPRSLKSKIDTITSPARVLILDIETAPLRSYTWGLWKQNVSMNQIMSDWFMLTWSAKWLFENKVFSDRLTSKEALDQNDKRISKNIWKLLDEADIIIAHNAYQFDIKRLNTRFLINGFDAPMPYQIIDTLEHAKKRFKISSNRLDYINKMLGLSRKIDTGGFELWDGCMKGDTKSLVKMEQYNIKDVKILEETYLRIRSWIKPHPNMGLFVDENITSCPSCGSTDISFGRKPYVTTACLYELFRCENCGSIGRNKKAIKNKTMGRSVPR